MKKSDNQKLPAHVAIIMDGNGRWAKGRNLDRTQGHIEGARRAEAIVDAANAMGIKVLTLFTFSTENWSRPESEISMLMNLLTTILHKKIDKLNKENIRFQMIGRKDKIPESVCSVLNRVVSETKANTGLTLNLAFNYGSRLEILDAVKNIGQAVLDQKIRVEDIDEQTIGDALYTRGLPDPDLLIRTSGEKRISNFLLWQLSYAEFYFTETFWPDFTVDEFDKAIVDYQGRKRRFGNLVETK